MALQTQWVNERQVTPVTPVTPEHDESKPDVLDLFPTPLYIVGKVKNFDEIQEELTAASLSTDYSYLHESHPTHFLSGSGLNGNILEEKNCNKFIKELHGHIGQYATAIGFRPQRCKIQASWISRFDKGHCLHIHNHGPVDFSGVYYLKTTGDDGRIFFNSSNPNLETSFPYRSLGERKVIKTQEGMLLLFPGWLQHGVETNTTDSSRMTLSFNISFSEILTIPQQSPKKNPKGFKVT